MKKGWGQHGRSFGLLPFHSNQSNINAEDEMDQFFTTLKVVCPFEVKNSKKYTPSAQFFKEI